MYSRIKNTPNNINLFNNEEDEDSVRSSYPGNESLQNSGFINPFSNEANARGVFTNSDEIPYDFNPPAGRDPDMVTNRPKRRNLEKNQSSDLSSQDLTQIVPQAIRVFNTPRGAKVYNNIKPDLINLVRKAKTGEKGKNRMIHFRKGPSISFLVRAAYQDYALRDILVELVGKGVGFFKVSTRTDQYRSLIQSVSDRLGEYQAEEIAMQTGMLYDREGNPVQPEYEAGAGTPELKKRAYELSPESENADIFNPGHIPEVARIQAEIDKAGSLKAAYKIFAKFAGNPNATVEKTEKAKEDKTKYDIGLERAKTKLKHMARQIWDYPELRGTLGNLTLYDTKEGAKMAVQKTYGGLVQTPVFYNAYYDREGPEGEKERADDWADKLQYQRLNGDLNHAGNHELGHVLGSRMVSPGLNVQEIQHENDIHFTENSILKEVLLNQNILTPQQKRGINVYNQSGINHLDDKGMVIPPNVANEILERRMQKFGNPNTKDESDPRDIIVRSKKYHAGQLNTSSSPTLEDRSLTSRYGSSSIAEMFAETFGDVYTHGTSAKNFSVAVVKEYEKRQKELQRRKYIYNQSNWFMKLFRKKVI